MTTPSKWDLYDGRIVKVGDHYELYDYHGHLAGTFKTLAEAQRYELPELPYSETDYYGD